MHDGKVFDHIEELNGQISELKRQKIDQDEVLRRFQISNNYGINKGIQM